jgi:two-component system, NtrC family, sensor kinase
MNRLAEATQVTQKAIAIADSSGQPYNIFQARSRMGSIFYMQKKYIEAIPFYEKGFTAMKNSDQYEPNIGDCYRELSECYEKTGKAGDALAAYKKYVEISDSIKSKENIRKATELFMKYDFDKQQQATQAEQDKINATAKAKQIALVVGLALTLLLAFVAFNGYRNKQKANTLLHKKNEEIEDTLAQLKATQSQLIQSEKMASLGELTAGIAHEIQNPINFVNNFSELNKELLVEMKDEMDKGNIADAKTIANDVIGNEEKINHHGKRADSIVKGMLQHSSVSSGQKEPTDINALAVEYLRLSYQGLRAKDKTFNATLQTDLIRTCLPTRQALIK